MVEYNNTLILSGKVSRIGVMGLNCHRIFYSLLLYLPELFYYTLYTLTCSGSIIISLERKYLRYGWPRGLSYWRPKHWIPPFSAQKWGFDVNVYSSKSWCNLTVLFKDAASRSFWSVLVPKKARISASKSLVFSVSWQKALRVFEMVLNRLRWGGNIKCS